MAEEQIKMYGTKWCPDCTRAKKILTQNEVPFNFIDIEADPDAAAYVEKVNKGFKSVPTIVFPDGSIMVEPASADLEKKIKK